MTDLVTTDGVTANPGMLSPITDGTGSFGDRLRAFAAQPSIKKVLPWFIGMVGIGLMALTWVTLSPPPQRVLYSTLGDAEKAGVVATLEQAGINYTIDNRTGTLTVGEDDVYRARMLVASDGSLASPSSGMDLIESLPMGASRTLEGDRLRAAQERELMMTIAEIDGVEAVRVHIAKAERSVFVREDVAPSASIMVRMARGRQLGDGQVMAIANLVAGSVPGLSIEAVKVVDQHGKLLTQKRDPNTGLIDMQAQMEAKLNAQVEQTAGADVWPQFLLCAGASRARYERGDVRPAKVMTKMARFAGKPRTQSQTAAAPVGGVPGVLANTPPADAEPREGAPEDTQDAQVAQGPTGIGESSATRVYEMGREVSVSSVAPGTVRYLSVAVAIDEASLAEADDADLESVKELVSAAVGARADRGDQVIVVKRSFEKTEAVAVPFYETSWFGMAVRNGVAILGVLLVLFLAVRPAIKALRPAPPKTD